MKEETFFTRIGCMDGRVQKAVAQYGREKFGATYPDTITDAGLVGLLSKENVDGNFYNLLKKELTISIERHHSKGVVVHGHQGCAAFDAVDDEIQKDNIRRSVSLIQSLIGASLPVVGVFVKRTEDGAWVAEELPQTLYA